MTTRLKAGICVLAAIGAFATVRVLTNNASAQGTAPPPPTLGQGGPGGPGGRGGGQGGGRRAPSNVVAKVNIDDAIKTATGKVSGFVNSATLRPSGPPGPDQKMVWVIHVVTTPGSPPAGPGGGQAGAGAPPPPNPGKGEDVAVDGTSGALTDVPPPPQRGGGRGGRGGGQAGGPPGAPSVKGPASGADAAGAPPAAPGKAPDGGAH